ncbi:hypothetical protein PB2503_10659 [Parvularcula bermudensis HTCC2503]|uniref:Uncharacterized protein n=1 Tax=Parvularcula bermudensis (strain ATCC BAA-594 / HTCC2503 / KCTC 12087) TaxID=314260 RepID=E0TH93_PARBH|nr:hypothetical protein PB2503_10659 [Parvularcula bermudensis HTCC2503]
MMNSFNSVEKPAAHNNAKDTQQAAWRDRPRFLRDGDEAKGENRRQGGFAHQDLCAMCSALLLAEEMGARLVKRALLLRAMPRRCGKARPIGAITGSALALRSG